MAKHSSSAGSPTILLVDDQPSILKLCKILLEGAGFTVLEANGSADALKICTEHHGSIDLLLTDLVLPPPRSQLVSPLNQFPHVHGQELAEHATRIRSGLRTILMSGNPDQELARHGIKRGTSPLLAKPFENDYLISLVQHVLVRPATPMVREQQSTAANEATS